MQKAKRKKWGCLQHQHKFILMPGTFLVEYNTYEILLDSTKMGKLGLMLANSMEKLESSGGGVMLIDAVKKLIEVNGPEKVLNLIKLLDSTARAHNVTVLLASALEFENTLKTKLEYLKL